MGKFYWWLGEQLSLYVRQIAWLNAVPKSDRKIRRLTDTEADDDRSRLQRYRDAGTEPALPPCDAQYMIGYLMEVGPVAANEMGRSTISWQELQAWAEATGVRLSSWEATTLRRLSQAYLAEGQAATKEDAPAPWSPPFSRENRAAVADRLAAIFGALVKD